MMEFPKDFFWGAANSAYQAEGRNINSDWWPWEKKANLRELSGDACRHYDLYQQDFDLAKSLGHNAHRFSIEWSRIQPQNYKFSSQEIKHYQDIVLSLKERNITPIVTLHHFTNPVWFSELGGWNSRKAYKYFLPYVEHIVSALADKVNYWVTINEPMVYIYQSYVLGIWPPQEKSLFKAMKARDNLVLAHLKSYRLIHDIYKKKKLPPPRVSIAKNMQAFVPCKATFNNKLAVYLRDQFFNFNFLNILKRQKALDFIGINYYTRSLVEARGLSFKNLFLDVGKKDRLNLEQNTLGWDVYPQGLYDLLVRLRKYKLPVFILENGICTENDAARWDFIRAHLKNIHLAVGKGLEVLGYIYWSLLDNFEWDKGFSHRFGLVDVDYRTYARTIRESAKKFALVCKTNQLE